MKELGLKCGFNDKSADIRIAQYESGKRLPDADTLHMIAQALGVSTDVFSNIGEVGAERLFSILYELEEQCGLHPCYADGIWSIRFEGAGKDVCEMMQKWGMAYEELVLKKNSLVAYDIWKMESLPEAKLKANDKEMGVSLEEKLKKAQKDIAEFKDFLDGALKKPSELKEGD